MQHENIELSFLSIFALITFFIFLLSQKFIKKIILDDDFNKPQSFHSTAIPRSGGLSSAIALIFLIFITDTIIQTAFYDYLTISLSIFLESSFTIECGLPSVAVYLVGFIISK